MAREKIQTGRVLNSDKLSGMGGIDIMNTQKRQPAIILVDTSGSMRGNEELLQNSVVRLYEEIMCNPVASNAVELGIMEFNDYIHVLVEPKEVYKQEDMGRSLVFECAGQTLTGLAVKEAIARLEKRIQEIKKAGIPHYSPILFLLSDGEPYCSIDEVEQENKAALIESIKKIENMVQKNKLRVVCVEVGLGCNHELMKKLTGISDEPNARVMNISSAGELADFFKWTSSYLIQSATGVIN